MKTSWSNPERVLCWTYLGLLCNALAATFSSPSLGIDHSYLSQYFQNKSKHFKNSPSCPRRQKTFKLLLRLVRQQRAILRAPHHICWVVSSARPGKTVFCSSCLVTASKEVRGAFKKAEISKSGRLPLLVVGVIMTGISPFKRKSSWMKWSPS